MTCFIYFWENCRTEGAEALLGNLRPEYSWQRRNLDSLFSAPSSGGVVCLGCWLPWRPNYFTRSDHHDKLKHSPNSQTSSRCTISKKNHSWTMFGFPSLARAHPRNGGREKYLWGKPGTRAGSRRGPDLGSLSSPGWAMQEALLSDLTYWVIYEATMFKWFYYKLCTATQQQRRVQLMVFRVRQLWVLMPLLHLTSWVALTKFTS